MQNILISKLNATSKMQKSVTELEKLYREKTGANFVIPSTRDRQEKVFTDPCNKIMFFFSLLLLLNFNFYNLFNIGSKRSTICGSILWKRTV